jgi:hypothetical protein
MRRIRRAERALGAVLVMSFTLMGCATSRRGPSPATSEALGGPTMPTEVATRCRDFAKRFDYAGRSVAGRSAVTVLLAPLAIGVGVAATAFTMNPQGLVLAVEGPAKLIGWTAQAGTENAAQTERLRRACEDGGGPDTVTASKAVRDLAVVRLGEQDTADATRLYRDALGILDRAGAGDSEEAAWTALKLVRLVAASTPASPEVGGLYERIVRILESGGGAQSGELGSVLALYAESLRASGRAAEAEVVEARSVASLSVDGRSAEERVRTAPAAERGTSVTGISVPPDCEHADLTVLDRLNQDAAATGLPGRIRAVDCHEDGRIRAVHLGSPAAEGVDVLILDEQDPDLETRIRPALVAAE